MSDKKTERQKRRQELDDFWQVDDLIPSRRAYVYPGDTNTAEILVDPPQGAGKAPAASSHPIPGRQEAEAAVRMPPPERYTPENSLFAEVIIGRWRNDYHYYEAFLRDALRLFAVRGVECRRKPFFSYVPQYSQMDVEQLNWYLWWRESMRAGAPIDTDFSYIQLYICELINLSRRTDAAVTREQLLLVWRHYRETFRQLDASLPEWICDHGLLHRLPAPALSGEEQLALMSRCRLREYFIPCKGDGPTADTVLTFCCNYDWRKSKFYTAEHRALYEKTIHSVIERMRLEDPMLKELLLATAGQESKMVRDAYSGAICAAEVKRKIEVRYTAFARNDRLKAVVTEYVKHTENRIRAYLGVRSRLSAAPLPERSNELMSRCLGELLPLKGRSTQRPEKPAYERLYDLPQKPLSYAEAARIETDSWDTTRRLVEAFSEEGEALAPAPVPTPAPPSVSLPQEISQAPLAEREGEPFAPYRGFLQAVLQEDSAAQRQEADRAGMLPEVFADRLNELAAEELGDILIEENGGAFCVIEDYRALAEQLLGPA